MELGNKEAKTIVKYSMQLAMLRKLLSAALITEEEYEKILGTLRKEYDILLGKIDMITGQVEKVIIGGYDEEGNKDPYRIKGDRTND